MLNKLCVYHLERATSKGQSAEQTRTILERNRKLFESSMKVLAILRHEFKETDAVKGQSRNRAEISSRTEAVDEDDLFTALRPQLDGILIPNVALFKYY